MVRENPAVLVPEGCKLMPSALEVCRVVDLGARFKGAKTFVEDTLGVVPAFYEDAGQHLVNWVAKAPIIKADNLVKSEATVKAQAAPTIFSGLFFKSGK